MTLLKKSLLLLFAPLLVSRLLMAVESPRPARAVSLDTTWNSPWSADEKHKNNRQEPKKKQHVVIDRWAPNALRIRIYPPDFPADADTAAALGYLLPRPFASSSKQTKENEEEQADVLNNNNNLEATVAADTGFITMKRISDGAVLLAQTTLLEVGPNVGYHDGSRAMNGTFTIMDQRVDRVFGGGCKCGGGYSSRRPHHHQGQNHNDSSRRRRRRRRHHYGAGAMLNTGDFMHGKGDLHWGVPIGMAKKILGPTPGGLGFMNGMPFHVAAVTGDGLSFGLFDNTMGWTYGTSSPARHSIRLQTNRATHLDFLFITYTAAAAETTGGSERANSILRAYADALGHVPEMPRQVTGYWHSKCSIASQQEATSTVQGFHRRGLHVDVLVLDYQYKICDGCTAFDPNTFPDPAGMVAELKSNHGTHVMAHVNIEQNFSSILNGTAFLDNDWYLHQQRNSTAAKTPLCRSIMSGNEWDSTTCRYDPTIPEARELMWKSVNATLVKAGIHMFWLDGNEIIGEDPWETPSAPLMDSPVDLLPSPSSASVSLPSSQHGRGQTMFSTGPNDVVGTFFPYLHQLTFAEGIAKELLPPPAMLLSRATTPGSWRLGGASWDGDHYCTFSDYLSHLYGSLDAQLSGQLWWSVDVGGFFCQMNEETMSRDFMLSVTAPIMRQHGDRDTRIWGPSWTPVMTAAATTAIKLRESLREYIHDQLAIAAETGVPLQRYLWHDFPEDATVWEIQSQFMFGSDFMVAPVVVENARDRTVYFPKGYDWVQHQNVTKKRRYAGGTSATVLVALDELPMFQKVPSQLDFVQVHTSAASTATVSMMHDSSMGLPLTLDMESAGVS
jgi:alpha-glucosidase (family GH31 glycosyl hydrolase)